jgi:hypothetical protein
LLPRDGDGAGDGSFTAPFKLEDVSEDVGEVADDCGERPSTTNKKIIITQLGTLILN